MLLRWYADEVERVTRTQGYVDYPKYRLQYWIEGAWLDLPCIVAPNAKIVEVNLKDSHE